jgi:hypothetical protein
VSAENNPQDGYAGMDALMAAITDEPLPPEAGEDAALLAEHRSAVADVALLREQLGIIGGALAEPVEVPRPAPVRPARPRPFVRFALGAVAVAVAAVVFSGMVWLVGQAGGGMSEDSGSADKSAAGGAASQSIAGYLACARLVVEGTVTAVEPAPGVTGQDRVTLRVTRYYKPERGKAEITFVTGEMFDRHVRKGERILAGFPRHEAAPDMWAVGEDEIASQRARIIKALPESRGLTCEEDG